MRISRLLVLFMIFALSGCALVDEFNFFAPAPEAPLDLNTITRSELIEIIESLQPEASFRVDFSLESFQDALVEVSESVRSSVIGVRPIGGFLSTGGVASGVIYKKDADMFYVVTNDHVVDGATRIEIVYEKNGLLFTVPSRDVTVLGTDRTTDLAVIRFRSSDNFSVATFADSYQTKVGEFVFAVGNPLGFNYYGTQTIGIISGLARYVPNSEFEVPFIQHDAAISPGNSGGGLFNINGELLGINNMKIVNNVASGIGFAIPSNTVNRIVSDLEENGRVIRPFLGVTSNVGVSDCGQDFGVCVTVQTGGAAEVLGLRNGDIIIGYKLETFGTYIPIRTFNDLREAILNSKVGDRVSIQYIRDQETQITGYAPLGVHPND